MVNDYLTLYQNPTAIARKKGKNIHQMNYFLLTHYSSGKMLYNNSVKIMQKPQYPTFFCDCMYKRI